MSSTMTISRASITRQAWPIILANSTVPLLGLADVAVLGNLGSVGDLGAVALGALIFSFVYWSFGFLRMGTTGLVAQAAGAGNHAEVRACLGRNLLLAGALGLVLIALQWPIRQLALHLLTASADVEAIAGDYVLARIWAAPATLATFVLMGLLVGLGASRRLLYLQLFLNVLNVVLDLWFAGVLGLGARGIALGTMIAEWSTLLVGSVMLTRLLRQHLGAKEAFWNLAAMLESGAVLKTLAVNRDIMIRTLLLVFSFAWFIDQSARFGDVQLAANHILLQLISFSAFFLDGYAFVLEALAGRAYGAGDRRAFDQAVRRSTELALVTALLLAAVILLLGPAVIALLTNLPEVREAAVGLRHLAALYVLLSFAAFQLDGIFIGATRTRDMRNAAILSLTAFLLAWAWIGEGHGVNGLWWAFILFVCARAAALLLFYRGLCRAIDLRGRRGQER